MNQQQILSKCNKERFNKFQAQAEEELNNLLFHYQTTEDSTLHYLIYLKEQQIKVSNSCNSALAYCLEITDEEPQGTPPAEGGGLCDIDVDIDKEERYRVIDYVIEKYGADKVAHVGTFGGMEAKAAIRDVARTLGFPYSMGDYLAKMTLEPISGKPQPLSLSYEKVPLLGQIRNGKDGPEKAILSWAEKFEKRKRAGGTHASAYVISQDKLSKTVPLCKSKKDDLPCTQFEMNNVEDVGLIKFDFLGLKSLTTINKCIELVKKRHGIDIDPLQIPVDDRGVYEALSSGDVSGVFQLDSAAGMRDKVVEIKPQNLEDIAAILSIYRPGPLAAPGLQEYLKVRSGESTGHCLFPQLEPILSRTDFFLIFQEQILEIFKDIAGFTLGESDSARRAIGKKKQNEMDALRPRFISGCVSNGVRKEHAETLFDEIAGHASYSFNKCLVGSTELLGPRNKKLTISDITPGTKLLSSIDGKIEIDVCEEVIDCGEQEVFDIEFTDESVVRGTKDHKFLCLDDRYHPVKDIEKYKCFVYKWLPKEKCFTCIQIKEVRSAGKEKVFNLSMRGDQHNYFLSNGLVSKNSHAVCYGYISYQMAWLKHHYLTEFMCASLICDSGNAEDVIKHLSYCKKRDIEVLGPDINESQYDFSIPEDRKIRFGLAAIKNLGTPVKEIISQRDKGGKFSSFLDFTGRINLGKINKKKLESLILSGAFDELNPNRSSLLSATSKVIEHKNLVKQYAKKMDTYWIRVAKYILRQNVLAKWEALSKEERKGKKKPGKVKFPQKPEPLELVSEKDIKEMSELTRLLWEKELLGFFISGHPVDLTYEYAEETINSVKELGAHKYETTILAIPNKIQEITTKKAKKKMAYVTLEDKTGTIECVMFPRVYEKYEQIMSTQEPFVFKVQTELTDNITKLNIQDVNRLMSIKQSKAKPIDVVVDIRRHKEITKFLLANKGGGQKINLSFVNGNNKWDMGNLFVKGERLQIEKQLKELM